MANLSSVCIVGSGAAALVTAHTLIKDGFTNVSILSRDRLPGGVWEPSKVYHGFAVNNLHGQYKFSYLPQAEIIKGHLSAEDMRNYFSKFAMTFLANKITYNTEVINIQRPSSGKGWQLLTRDTEESGTKETMYFDKVVLCTGGCSEPRIPKAFSEDAILLSKFKGIVVHSCDLETRLNEIMDTIKPADEANHGTIVVIGGGKSAQDIAAYLAHPARRRKVTMVFETVDATLVGTERNPIPDYIRKSRLLGVMSPNIDLETGLEKFLHTTTVGSWIVRGFWDHLEKNAFRDLSVSRDSPLRNTQTLFWGLRPNVEEAGRPDAFYSLANAGHIKLIGPARALGFGDDGRTLCLSDGRVLKVDVLVLATGYTSSWGQLFDHKTADELGIARHLPLSPPWIHEWDQFRTLSDAPSHAPGKQWAASIWRGIVPAKNIHRRDFAINGAVFSSNNGYVFEVSAHFISSYFLEDSFLQLPATPADAIRDTDRTAAWMRKRYPHLVHWTNSSHSSVVLANCWPQYVDRLLRDMGLEDRRSGGNWFNWVFKPIDQKELASLGRERTIKRMQNV